MGIMKTVAMATAFSASLAACGGGGDSGASTAPSGSTTTNNGATLLAAYTPPADIAAAVVQNYSGPAMNLGNSGMQTNCAIASKTSTTVVDAPNVIVFAANGASLKAQELAADLFEHQAMPTIRGTLGLPTTGVAFDGTNKVQICVDSALGVSDGETGTSMAGQSNLGGAGPIMMIMSADSPNFDARYPGTTSYTSPVGQSYASLLVHEGTHAALFSLAEPFGGMETWFQEGMAATVARQPIGSKASVLAAAQAADLLAAHNPNSNMNAYGAYEATVQYLTSTTSGGLGFGLTNIKHFVAAYQANAMAACSQPIPSGVTPTAAQTAGMPAGYENVCVAPPGGIDSRLETAFDQAFNSTFKDSNGAPLLLHTADGANSLEATLQQRLDSYLP
ncbi:hypothetical protein LGM65_25865 [Burkholderia anthina]|uniref:hypothetical protein n=1 Tax=Burkholderia anthina TaxID=179879 RepID=UPI001CF5AF5F|nr:hypothetical protein [Burkholderia anthina]MCA8094265.1 hypothetical protein [Burkholderia anthina]